MGFDVACNVHALSSLPPILGASLHDMVRNPYEAGMCINTTLASSRSDVFSLQAPTLATRLRVILRLPGCGWQVKRRGKSRPTPHRLVPFIITCLQTCSLLQFVMCSIPDVTTETQVLTFQDKHRPQASRSTISLIRILETLPLPQPDSFVPCISPGLQGEAEDIAQSMNSTVEEVLSADLLEPEFLDMEVPSHLGTVDCRLSTCRHWSGFNVPRVVRTTP